MAKAILSNRHSLKKGDSNQRGVNGLFLLGAQLRSIKSMTNVAVRNPNMTEVDMFDILFGVDAWLQTACQLCDELDPKQIAADVSAQAAEPNTAE